MRLRRLALVALAQVFTGCDNARVTEDAAVGDAAPGQPDGGACVDMCPAPGGGVTWGCERRFMYGVNYAWLRFGGDFGGIAQWGQGGVAAEEATHAQNLAAMRAHGASVIRWWVLPDFRGDGIAFDGDDAPVGLGGSALADLEKALQLADQADVYLMLTLFSFDAFRPSEDVAGIWTPGLRPIVLDPAKRTALLEDVVRPFARAAAESPYARRLIAWDVINEPEWAMAGASPYGDMDYTPSAGLETLTHAEMEDFVGDVIAVLDEESGALVSVGAAAFKWAHAWQSLPTDFHHFHMYEWIDTWWPYTGTPADYDLADKPLVMGELPMGDLAPGAPYAAVLGSWWDHGYAGALGWMYTGATAAELDNVKAFADQHPCETSYGPGARRGVTPPPLPRAAVRDLRRCTRAAAGPPVCQAIRAVNAP